MHLIQHLTLLSLSTAVVIAIPFPQGGPSSRRYLRLDDERILAAEYVGAGILLGIPTGIGIKWSLDKAVKAKLQEEQLAEKKDREDLERMTYEERFEECKQALLASYMEMLAKQRDQETDINMLNSHTWICQRPEEANAIIMARRKKVRLAIRNQSQKLLNPAPALPPSSSPTPPTQEAGKDSNPTSGGSTNAIITNDKALDNNNNNAGSWFKNKLVAPVTGAINKVSGAVSNVKPPTTGFMSKPASGRPIFIH